jgi:hypothetical protein
MLGSTNIHQHIVVRTHPEINIQKLNAIKSKIFNQSIVRKDNLESSHLTDMFVTTRDSFISSEDFFLSTLEHTPGIEIDHYKLIYHSHGENVCNGPSTLLKTNARLGDLVTTSLVKHIDGSYYLDGDIFICDTCLNQVRLPTTEYTEG